MRFTSYGKIPYAHSVLKIEKYSASTKICLQQSLTLDVISYNMISHKCDFIS